MKKIVLAVVLLSVSLLAQKAVFVDIVSENIIKVEKDGKVQRLHLAGIELFSKANKITKQITLDQKQNLKKQVIIYMQKHLKIGKEFSYSVVYRDNQGVEKVWLDDAGLNYKMVRDGYALVDLNDDFLPSFLQMRMTMAMKYAKEKKLGLWGEDKYIMASLIDSSKHICGWNNEREVPAITKQSILKGHQDALPYVAKIYLAKKVVMK